MKLLEGRSMKNDHFQPISPDFAYIERSLTALNSSRYADAIRLLDDGLNQHLAQADNLDVHELIKHVSAFINYLEFRLEEDFGINEEGSANPEPSRVENRCSFCGDMQSQVKRLIAGPAVFICDSCIKTCSDA